MNIPLDVPASRSEQCEEVRSVLLNHLASWGFDGTEWDYHKFKGDYAQDPLGLVVVEDVEGSALVLRGWDECLEAWREFFPRLNSLVITPSDIVVFVENHSAVTVCRTDWHCTTKSGGEMRSSQFVTHHWRFIDGRWQIARYCSNKIGSDFGDGQGLV